MSELRLSADGSFAMRARGVFAMAMMVAATALARAGGAAPKTSGGPHPVHGNVSPPSAGSAAPAIAASALVPGGAASAAGAGATRPGAGSTDDHAWATCTEHLPSGATRPGLKEQFPSRGVSGYASTLELVVEHGQGETVFPQGFSLQSGGEAARAFAEAGFLFPDPDGGVGPTLTTTTTASGATTNIAIPVLVLPKNPGRNAMTLPPVPVAVARASGELFTLCTTPHNIIVEDPTSSTPDAAPRRNPPGRSQLEEWTLAKQLTIGAALGAALAALLAWLLVRWRRRPKPVPPPPPPRPPWEVALEELFAVRHAGLVQDARYAEHYDRVSDAVRKYLGGRYGFDGLETTTPEMVSLLRRVDPQVSDLPVILGFLDECDLVKFARFTPSDEDCARVLEHGEHIVRVTTPRRGTAPSSAPRTGETRAAPSGSDVRPASDGGSNERGGIP